jgi:hypothetical protein
MIAGIDRQESINAAFITVPSDLTRIAWQQVQV